MSRTLADLLNPSDPDGQQVQAQIQAGLVDIQPQLQQLSELQSHGARASPEVQQQLQAALKYLQAQRNGGPYIPNDNTPPPIPGAIIRQHDVRLTSRTTLSTLYHYPLHTILEYPETNADGTIGHLFRMDPDDWQVPDLNIVYLRGAPTGRMVVGKEIFNDVMVDARGNQVACSSSHSTCQGVKICPYSDEDTLSEPHTRASREDVQQRLANDREDRLQYASPSKDIFCRTAAYVTALRKLGCSRPSSEELESESSPEEIKLRELYWQQVQCGYCPKEGTCKGRIVYETDSHGNPHVRCEHYCRTTNRDHFHDNSVGAPTGSYDLGYIQAVLTDDEEEATCIEQAAFKLGYGPLVECTTVANVSSQKPLTTATQTAI
ncbi:hypothetical protein B0H17DRAFT_1144805 [Mycena rosella]|uniref:Uncharacterized protein n=1 Tax=Mycena rosella TaxID=1033263 RepID=A0AAD7G5B3_MYCRO|nr:hypothetical protein B0H17DRAFT_1144805 [Mycena rosella]